MTLSEDRRNAANIDFTYVAVSAKWIIAFTIAIWISIPVAVQALIIFMALDFATGLLAGFITHTLCSEKSFNGLARKVMILLLVSTAQLMTRMLKMDLPLGNIVAMAYVVNEIISITQNAARSGAPIPPALLKALMNAKSITGRNVDASTIIHKLDSIETVTDSNAGTHSEIKSSISETVSKT